MEQLVNFQTQNGVLEIQFNRADKKNALTNAMYQAVQTAMEQAKSDDNIRVILFTSTGDFFTAGNDLVDFLIKAENDDAELNALDFVQFLGDYPKPIVAAVTGSGVGIGLTLLLHCDLVYIVENAKLLAPFVDLSLVPEAGSTLLLTQKIGYQRAFEVFVMGEKITGKQAVELGLANQAFASSDEVLSTARQKAEILAKKSVSSVRQTKDLMRNATEILARIQQENTHFSNRLQTDEVKAILRKFVHKQ